MAEKRIQVVVDIESKDVQFATDRVLSLQQQIRLLTKEIQNVDPSSESFRLLSKKLNDTQDQLRSVRARSGELFQTFSLLPGPIGEISAKLDGGISLLKTFSQYKLSDLINQFKGLGRDLKDAFLSLGDWQKATEKSTQSSEELTQSNEDLSDSYTAVDDAAAANGSQIQRNIASTKSLTDVNNENITVLKQKISAETNLQNSIKAKLAVEENELQTLKTGSKEYKEKAKVVQSLNNEYINSTNYQARYTTELNTLTAAQQKNTTAATADAVAQGEVAVASQAAGTATKTQTVLTNALTGAQTAAAAAGRVLRAVLASLGIGLIIVAVTTLITKVYDWVTSTEAADRANEKLGETLEQLNRILEDNISLIDEETQIGILRAQMANKTEKEINDITIAGIDKRIEAYKKGREKLMRELELLSIQGLSDEDEKKRREEIQNQYFKLNETIEDLNSQRRIQEVKGEKALFDEQKKLNEKRSQDRKEAGEKELERRKAELDALIELEIRKNNTDKKVLEDLLNKRLELEKLTGAQLLLAREENRDKLREALKEDVDEDLKIRLESIDAIIEKEESAADVDIERLKKLLLHKRDLELRALENSVEDQNLILEKKQALVAKYDAQIREIDNKAREEKLIADIAATEGNFDEQIRLYKEFQQQAIDNENYNAQEKLQIIEDTNNKIQELNQRRIDFERGQIELDLMEKEISYGEYFDNLKQLYDDEIAAVEQAYKNKEITEEEHNRRIKELTDARIQIRQEEIETSVKLFGAIGQGLSALSGIVGEQTKAGKALAVAAALINTYAAIAGQLAAFAGVPIPGYAIAQAIATGLVGFAQVKKILSVNVPGAGTSSGGQQPPPGSTPVGPIQVQAGGRARGGYVEGPGTSLSDSIPAMLSNGEFVVNARSTEMFGGLLNLINSAGNQPRMQFALGGQVTPQNAPVMQNGLDSLLGIQDRPIKTYVVANEMSNQQQFDRTIKSRSLI